VSEIVVLASDHNAVALKDRLRAALLEDGYWAIDIGPYSNRPAVDYTDYARQAAMIVARGDASKAILCCGTGIGMSVVANKTAPNVRAALVHNDVTARLSREHNDSNVLALGAWIRSDEENVAAARVWLTEGFGELRHVRRVEKIAPEPRSKIVFTNGVFDIVHQGHLTLLKWAASLGERLVVGVNSDTSTRLLKGPARPINKEADRKAVLEALRFVDEVIIFNEISARSLIAEIRPSIVVKGGEWLAEEVRARDLIPDDIEVKVFPVVQGYSTTRIVELAKGP